MKVVRRLFAVLCCAVPPVVSAQTLPESILLAINNHPDVERQRVLLEQESVGLEQIEAGLLPEISASLGVGREDSNNATTRALVASSAEMERREASLSLSQLLFDGKYLHWKQEAQKSAMAAEQAALEATVSEVALRAAEAHFELGRSQSALQASAQNFARHEKVASGIRKRAESGKDDRSKVARVEARLALSMSNLELARAELLQAESLYRSVIGQSPEELAEEDDIYASLPSSLSLYLEQVLLDNPRLNAQRLRVESAEREVSASSSDYFPKLYFESGASWNDNLDGVRGRNNDAWAMLRLKYDIYQGGVRSARERSAQLARMETGLQQASLERELRRDAEQSWYAMESAVKRVEFLENYTLSSEQTVRAYDQQFKIGQRSLSDLLDAENELLNARLQYLRVIKELSLSRLQVLHYTGSMLDQLTLPVTEN